MLKYKNVTFENGEVGVLLHIPYLPGSHWPLCMAFARRSAFDNRFIFVTGTYYENYSLRWKLPEECFVMSFLNRKQTGETSRDQKTVQHHRFHIA